MSASAEKELVVLRTAEQGANENTEVTFVPTPFAKGKRKELGIKYPAFPTVTPETLELAINFFGNEDFFAMINQEIRLWMQQVFNAVCEANAGEFSETLFVKYVSELSTRGETKEEIEASLTKLRGELIAIGDKMEKAETDEDKASITAEWLKVMKELKKYDAILASKKRVPRAKKSEDEDDAATPAAQQA